jgi:putative tryptophan/tyrosine transport system substrate-binding protein
MKRREFIGFLACSVLSSLAARAEQGALPVIGFLSNASSEVYAIRLEAFRSGLLETGLVEGKNVAIEYRWTNGHSDQLAPLAAELVQRQVAVIVSGGGTATALAAKAATSTIPVVFAVSANPVEAGLVGSLNHPSGNLTGVTSMNVEIGPKRLEVLRALLPTAINVAVLLNPTNPTISTAFVRQLEPAARVMGFQLHWLKASTDRDLDEAFAALAKLHADALVIGPDTFFNSRAKRLAAMTLRDSVPAIYQYRAMRLSDWNALSGPITSSGTPASKWCWSRAMVDRHRWSSPARAVYRPKL